MEIPIVELMKKQVFEKDETVCNQTNWNSISTKDAKLQTVMEPVINATDGYYFILPEDVYKRQRAYHGQHGKRL